MGLPKKLWVKISSKKFWKDPIKYEQIFIPKDNVLYILRPESICDLQNTSSESQSTIDLVIKDASLAFKG